MVNIQKNNSENNSSNSESGETIIAFLLSCVRTCFPEGKLAIAVSGGVDSMALLHAAHIVARERHTILTALHVHHDLQNVADDWLNFVSLYCKRNGIQFASERLQSSQRQKAQSIEDWARQGRYAALAKMAIALELNEVWLAQHEDDQIETHLLQKARGAGAKGQAAMPAIFQRANVCWQRPWLTVSRAQIETYARRHNVAYVTDPSNSDTRFARNALRAQHNHEPIRTEDRTKILQDILAAQHQNEVESLWASTVLAQYHSIYRPELGELSRLNSLNLLDFSNEQQMILIRYWLREVGMRMPSRSALKELIKQLTNSRIDQHMCWWHPDGFLVTKFRQNFIAAHRIDSFHAEQIKYLEASKSEYGIPTESLREHGLVLRPRVGGESLRLHPKRPRVSLKIAFQAAGIAPALRAHLPLVYCGEQLVYVAGLGVNVDTCVLGGVRIVWHPES